MFPFLRKKSKKNKQVEHEIDAQDVLEDGEESNEDEELVDTSLSIHPKWHLPEEEKYVFAFHNNGAKPLKKNQLSIATVDLEERDGQFHFVALIRQTLEKSIELAESTICLLDEDHQIVGRKNFDLTEVGKIPPMSSRPWEFVFTKEDLQDNSVTPNANWSLAFELKKKHQLDLEDSWKKSLASESIEKLEQIVASAQPLKPGEVNLMGIDAKVTDDQQLAVTILIRNGANKDITLEKLPLMVSDASGEAVARGAFSLDGLQVKSNTSKPWRFIFPSSLLLKDTSEIDLSEWKVEAIQK
ncbi:accessory Sec system S-layer assembly protein [Gracilibacillus sp. YIM 98692]|uniref:accessory Sec system S-layer assembly protein n=1 Tax=Gracilibacillus sp. YIM 98692 TaxID=2663532 RepID=UPI0013D4A558|nr:accessory Sec system S-layer assembly protein [Gracilibacillus sp. YIM 98692]